MLYEVGDIVLGVVFQRVVCLWEAYRGRNLLVERMLVIEKRN